MSKELKEMIEKKYELIRQLQELEDRIALANTGCLEVTNMAKEETKVEEVKEEKKSKEKKVKVDKVKEVAKLVKEGKKASEIAELLGIKPKTVAVYLSHSRVKTEK